MVVVVCDVPAVVVGLVVVVVVTVLFTDGLEVVAGLDTETLDEPEPLRDDLDAPAPLELVLPLLELELDVDALDEPELVLELDEPELDLELELEEREALAPALLAVLPLDDIMHPPVYHQNHSLDVVVLL